MPLQFLHRNFLSPCLQKPDPQHSLHLYLIMSCSQISASLHKSFLSTLSPTSALPQFLQSLFLRCPCSQAEVCIDMGVRWAQDCTSSTSSDSESETDSDLNCKSLTLCRSSNDTGRSFVVEVEIGDSAECSSSSLEHFVCGVCGPSVDINTRGVDSSSWALSLFVSFSINGSEDAAFNFESLPSIVPFIESSHPLDTTSA